MCIGSIELLFYSSHPPQKLFAEWCDFKRVTAPVMAGGHGDGDGCTGECAALNLNGRNTPAFAEGQNAYFGLYAGDQPPAEALHILMVESEGIS